MIAKKYDVRLSVSERGDLKRLTSRGVTSVRKYKRARVLLLADASPGHRALDDEEIAKRVDVSVGTVERIRRRYAQEGLSSALSEKPRPGRPAPNTSSPSCAREDPDRDYSNFVKN